jgi:hypothetical protein
MSPKPATPQPLYEHLTMTTTLIGNFRELTAEEKQQIAEWCRSDKAKKLFKEANEKVERESEDFQRRTTISYEQLHKPFTI